MGGPIHKKGRYNLSRRRGCLICGSELNDQDKMMRAALLPTPTPTPTFNNHQQWQQHYQNQMNPTSSTMSSRRRRSLTLSVFPLLLFPSSSSSNAGASSVPEKSFNLEPYIDTKEGFTLLVPSSWTKVEKAGATALFEEEGKGSNNIGVVVNPVRLSSLTDFGTPQFVLDKLIQAEKRKESTKEAEVVAATQKIGRGGLPVYEFEYTVDSTRGGMKRIFSAAFVASKKLYLLNISHADSPDNPLDSQTRTLLEQVLHSFDTSL